MLQLCFFVCDVCFFLCISEDLKTKEYFEN